MPLTLAMIEKFISTNSILKREGWIRSLIRQLLGEPDRIGRNPYFPNGGPAQLHLWDKMIEAEKDERWLEFQRKRKTRDRPAGSSR